MLKSLELEVLVKCFVVSIGKTAKIFNLEGTIKKFRGFKNIFATIMCRNDELSLTIQSFLSYDLFAENSQIHLKISVIPILFKFHLSGSTYFVSKQPTQLIVQLNSSLRHIIVTFVCSMVNLLRVA